MLRIFALRTVSNLIDESSAGALFRELWILLRLFDRGVADDRPLHRLVAFERVGTLGVVLRPLKVVLSEATAMFGAVNLGDAESVEASIDLLCGRTEGCRHSVD